MGRMAIVLLVIVVAAPARGALIPGGGPSASDCYVELDVVGANGGNKLICVDGDPSCDSDGQCQGACTFSVSLCVNQSNVAGCTPAAAKKPLTVKGATLSLPAATGVAPACGAATAVAVPLKGKQRTKRGKKRIKVTAVVDGKPPRDADRLVLLCMPREGACPTTTTTIVVTSTTTTTTLPPVADAQVLLVGERLARFSTADPSVVEAPVDVVGLTLGDTLVGIDRRPQNGFLYGLGFNAGAGTVQLYAVGSSTGQATPIGATGVFVDGLGDPVTIGAGIGTRFGVDFNPTTDRVRVVNDAGQNFRINPNTGSFVDGNLGGGIVAGVNMDGPLNGTTDTVQETAYSNAAPSATVTTQYTLDPSIDALCIQNPPNLGTQTVCKALGSAIDAVLGFDIPPGVDAPASNEPAVGSGVAVVRPAGQPAEFLAGVDLTTGALGTPVALGTSDVVGLAIQRPASIPMIALLTGGVNLLRFTAGTPGTTTSVLVTGVTAGETLVSIDFRPQTGHLLALGINATANTGTLYMVDPQTGAATAIGSPSQIAFVDDSAAPVDFPDPAVVAWGIDVNPTVDRVRVVAGSGLTFRVNPNSGAPVDGNLGGAAILVGTNTDGPINGLTTSVHEAAYTNNVGQSLAGGVTTLYTLDALTDAFYIQAPPNAGTQTSALPVTVGGAPIDFTALCGFDIPAGVDVAAANVPVTEGVGWAALTVSGATHLYRIDLPTGAATDVGAIGTGSVPIAGLTVGNATLQ